MKKATFVFTLLLLPLYSITAQARGSSEQDVQELAQKMIKRVQNPDENLGLLTDIQAALRPHLDFISNTLPEMQTDPEFEPYIERYEALKGQYMGNGQPIPINPDIKIFLSASPFLLDYNESLNGTGVYFYYHSVIVIDRGFWEHYRGNNEIRQAVLLHELGHCDLEKEADSHNGIMNRVWIDSLLNEEIIDWEPIYEEFFVMQQRQKVIVCSEDNFHLYEECSDPRFLFQSLICHGEKSDTTCYIRRDSLINDVKGSLPLMKCLLFNLNSSTCFDSL